LLNASVGVQRVLERLRRPENPERATTDHITDPSSSVPARPVRVRVRSVTVTRFAAHRPRRAIHLPHPTRASIDILERLGHERAVAVVVAAIVLGASFLSLGTSGAPGGATGGPSGDGPAPRIAIGGADDDTSTGDDEGATGDVAAAYTDITPEELAAVRALPPASTINAGTRPDPVAEGAPEPVVGTDTQASAELTSVEGPFLADGTLLKPVAVDTTVDDGSDLVRTYKVKAGDTLVGIARAHGVSMMTLWWANKLKNKDDLHQGQVLRIPPVTGLVVKVKAGDTLTELSDEYKVTETEILETNEITDPNLVVGQVLILPGAKGDPIPTPKPTKKPVVHSSRGSSGGSSGGSSRPPKTYNGGNFRWPTSSHHISQYYHYGHYGLDIDGSTGDPIYAAAGGTVTFAGWKSNGGGYQVWIAHGSGLYTTYNHMSSVSVGRGQHVGRGQRVGRMGATGNATGSHLHFEVWKGPIWSGGRRVNPLAYL
jgi:murein DD-endopeptidase MepM/ murein hydrolase activator NlpD